MDGAIDWAALPVVCDMLGLADIEQTVRLMRLVIDEWRRK